jgi:cyanophycinase-like exopeptidase
MAGFVTLIGSGETSAGMVRVHKELLAKLSESPRVVFLDTPAGFEMGLEAIQERFMTYFEHRLGLRLRLASFRRQTDAPASVAAALDALAEANYILAGPGSPSYAVRQLGGSLVWEAVLQRWMNGAQLVFASAAAIAIGRHLLPVYEIYKVGEEPAWKEGLDLLGRFGLDLAIIPHWDNTEGGTHDTSRGFIGKERFGRLRSLLPSEAVVLGIDEHTACTLDLEARRVAVRGKSGVTILRGNEEARFCRGESFPLSALIPAVGGLRPVAATDAQPITLIPGAEKAPGNLRAEDLPALLRELAQHSDAEMAVTLQRAALAAQRAGNVEDRLHATLRLLVDLRDELREAEEWKWADLIRERLAELGIALHDTGHGTRWEEQS